MISAPPDIEESIRFAANAESVPVSLVRAVAYHESRFNPTAISPVGAKGIMQLMPVVIQEYGVSDPFDPDQSLRVGANMLKKLKARHGSWASALAAYQWGTANVRNNPSPEQWPQSTRDYVARVLATAGLEPSKSAMSYLVGAGLVGALALFLLKVK
jgi:soluble lytic murein transglycosylase-like protein